MGRTRNIQLRKSPLSPTEPKTKSSYEDEDKGMDDIGLRDGVGLRAGSIINSGEGVGESFFDAKVTEIIYHNYDVLNVIERKVGR